jgi:hypothetical protein
MRNLVFLVLLSGCGATSYEMYLQDGQKGHHVRCAAGSWGACFEKAGAICGEKGYDIVERGSEADRRLLIRCKR